LPETEDAAVPPDKIQPQRQNRKREKLPELIQPKVGDLEPRVFGRQHIEERDDDQKDQAGRKK
jgi:hypothetical protein